MKLNGFVGKGTGKLGSSVFAVSGGEQIVRQYNPNVSNPNTDAQVEQRAKLKLMSQLAAVLAPGIAFKKDGLVSARNKFIQANIGKCSFAEGKATIPLSSIDLTGGAASFPEISATASGSNPFAVSTAGAVAENVDAVVYVMTKQTDDSTLEVVGVQMVNTPGAGRTFPTTFENGTGEFIFYAYGLYNSSKSSRVRYESYIAQIGDDEASLGILNSLLTSGAAATKTVSATI